MLLLTICAGVEFQIFTILLKRSASLYLIKIAYYPSVSKPLPLWRGFSTRQGHISDHGSENSSNHPPVNSLVSFTFSFTYLSNINPYFYISVFLQYNHLRTLYTYLKKVKPLTYSLPCLFLFYNSD